MFYMCPLCLYTLISWLSYENCIIINDYNEKCRLWNSCNLHRGYADQHKDFNFCLEDVCDSHTRGLIYSNCHYDQNDA